MNKRGILLKTIELVFSAVLILAFIVLVIKLVEPALQSDRTQVDADFERFVEEAKLVKTGWPDIPVRTIGFNFSVIFYNHDDKAKPEECLKESCACLYEGTKILRCENIRGVSNFLALPRLLQIHEYYYLLKIVGDHPYTIYAKDVI
jgi:hypothetical protein